jgi:cytochrome P450
MASVAPSTNYNEWIKVLEKGSIENLESLSNIVNETLRIDPPVKLSCSMKVTEQLSIGGY